MVAFLWSRRLSVRALVFATLLGLSLEFPSPAPSRWRLTVRAHSLPLLQARMEDAITGNGSAQASIAAALGATMTAYADPSPPHLAPNLSSAAVVLRAATLL